MSLFTDTLTTRHQNRCRSRLRRTAFLTRWTLSTLRVARKSRTTTSCCAALNPRRDVEFTLMTDQAEVLSGTRKTGALPSWISNNSFGASHTANGSFTADGDNLRSLTQLLTVW